jgi:hypothetical protein
VFISVRPAELRSAASIIAFASAAFGTSAFTACASARLRDLAGGLSPACAFTSATTIAAPSREQRRLGPIPLRASDQYDLARVSAHSSRSAARRFRLGQMFRDRSSGAGGSISSRERVAAAGQAALAVLDHGVRRGAMIGRIAAIAQRLGRGGRRSRASACPEHRRERAVLAFRRERRVDRLAAVGMAPPPCQSG